MKEGFGECAECGNAARRRLPLYGDREVVLHVSCQRRYDARSEAEGAAYVAALAQFHEEYGRRHD